MQTTTRRYERVSFLCKLEIQPLPAGPVLSARSLDLSLGGVGLLTKGVLPVGELISVSFFFKDSKQKDVVDSVMGKVVYVAADTEANRIGVEFVEPLREETHPQLSRKLMSL